MYADAYKHIRGVRNLHFGSTVVNKTWKVVCAYVSSKMIVVVLDKSNTSLNWLMHLCISYYNGMIINLLLSLFSGLLHLCVSANHSCWWAGSESHWSQPSGHLRS